jgi:hypothetical protein
MIETVINIRNWDRVQNNMRATVAFHKNGLDRVGYQWAQGTRQTLVAKPYPAYAGKGSGKRTYKMKRSFAVERVRPSHYKIVNRATNKGFNYPVLVIGKRQRPYNKHWWKMADVVNQRLPILRDEIDKELRNLERA